MQTDLVAGVADFGELFGEALDGMCGGEESSFDVVSIVEV